MKPITAIMLLLLSVRGYCQDDYYVPGKPNIKIPRKANTVIIESILPAEDFIMDYARQLEEYGFSVERINKELLSLSTNYKPFNHTSVATIKLIVYARQNGQKSAIVIRGAIEVAHPFTGAGIPYTACNCGFFGDARQNGFIDIIKSLDGFHYDTIRFEMN